MDNFFTGTIPIFCSAFAGSIPIELGQLHHLRKVSLHGNDLTGNVPEELCELSRGPYNLGALTTDCLSSAATGNPPAVACLSPCCVTCSVVARIPRLRGFEHLQGQRQVTF
jgi:hypothetical protein